MYDEDGYWQAMEEEAEDKFIDDLFDSFLKEHGPEIRAEAVHEFTYERLQSYYLDAPSIAKAPLRRLRDAHAMLPTHPSAALVMAASALEVGLKVALLKPIVYGVVHQDWLAEAVAELAVTHTGLDRFKRLLFPILKEYTSVDPVTYVRQGAEKPLWQEVLDVQRNRNRVVHRAEEGTLEQAEQAVETAAAILETILPKVLTAIGLTMHMDEIVEL